MSIGTQRRRLKQGEGQVPVTAGTHPWTHLWMNADHPVTSPLRGTWRRPLTAVAVRYAEVAIPVPT